MTKLEALTELAAKVKDGAPYEMDMYMDAFPNGYTLAYKADRGSLDAAKALHEVVLPGWTSAITQNMHHSHWNVYVTFILSDGSAIDRSGYSKDNPARAWLLAIIRALSAEEEGK